MSRFTLGIAQLLAVIGIAAASIGQVRASSGIQDRVIQDSHALDAVSAPVGLSLRTKRKPVVVAIVDDGVRINHQELTGFIWQNPRELPANNIDDDGNGYVDDVNGWDVSDSDNTLTAPEDRLEQYSHGTHIAALVAQLARRAYGEDATDAIRIMPVKAMSDTAEKLYIKEGFEGIRYAIDAGADIILCAWGVNHVSPEQQRILQEAEEKGILIVAAAGNFPQELEQYPAAERSVLAVAGLDALGQKWEKSAYGQFVDIAAPAMAIQSASAISDSSYQALDGTSMAAAIAAGGAAMVSVEHPEYTPVQISACLLSSVDSYAGLPADLAGKLGAGKLNIGSAIRCELLQDPVTTDHVLSATKGYLRLRTEKKKLATWSLAAPGRFKGIRFRPVTNTQASGKGVLKFYAEQTSEAPGAEFQLNALPESYFTPASSAYLTLQSSPRRGNADPLLAYEYETIDFSKEYCSGTQKLSNEGVIEDGSGANDYAPASDCKWLITAPEGQLVNIRFTEFDTEAYIDLIYFFNGAGTHEDIMARFSGPGIPPELTTWSNQVLVWFVTNRENQGKGWKAEVRFVNP